MGRAAANVSQFPATTAYSEDIHRSPPHSVEGEQGVLGSMLLDRAAVAECADKVDEDYFYIPAHQTIFALIVERWKAGQACDLITITQVLRDRNILETVGGAGFVTNLFTFVPTSANVGYYLEIVRDKYILRQIIVTATESVRRAYEEQDEVNLLLDEFQAKAVEIGVDRGEERTAGALSRFVPAALEEIIWHYHNRGKCAGISTGFADLDRMMNGFEKGKRPYCFAARPSMGKSALMLGLARNIALAAAVQRKRVKIFSVEMTGQSLAKRLICDLGNIRIKALRDGFMDDGGKERAQAAAEQLMTDYINVDEKGDLTITEFIARARRAVVKHKVDLIMVDYLQRMKGSSKRARDNRQLEINEIAMGISETSKELRVPIVVLAQLNRNPEERKAGRPELGDLRESGSIEQEMGFVGLLYRPSYYCENDPGKMAQMMKDLGIEDEEDFKEYAECIIAKQNEGPTHPPVPLRFVKDYARYEPEDPDRPLFSTNLAKRQTPKNGPPPAKDKAEIRETIDEFFPGSTVRDDER